MVLRLSMTFWVSILSCSLRMMSSAVADAGARPPSRYARAGLKFPTTFVVPRSVGAQNASCGQRCVRVPFPFGRARGLDHRFGDALGVEGPGTPGFRKSLVTILPPFSSRYI